MMDRARASLDGSAKPAAAEGARRLQPGGLLRPSVLTYDAGMIEEVELTRAYRTTPTGLYLFTTWADGHANVQFAFRALGIQDDPPRVLVGVQHSNYSLNAFRQSREFGLNVCSHEQVHAIDASRGLSGRDEPDKIARLGLETFPAKHIKAPLIADCHANVECRVVASLEGPGVTLFLAEALACYLDPERPPVLRLAGKTYRLGEPA
jgi:flavin reductase (DIM6/NTAB) family NADH-FMN oxidoreductase RutF